MDIQRIYRVRIIAGIASATLGFLSLAGWMLFPRAMSGIGPELAAMAPGTAVCFILLGLLLAVDMPEARDWKRAAASSILAICSIYNLLLVVSGFSTAVSGLLPDVLVLRQTLSGFMMERTSPVTGVLFAAIGLALLLRILFGKYRFIPDLLAGSGFLTFVVGLAISLAHFYGSAYHSKADIVPVSVATGVGFALIGLAVVLAAGPSSIAVRSLTDPSPKARLLRWLIPATLLLVLFDGFWDLHAGEWMHLPDPIAKAGEGILLSLIAAAAAVRLSDLVFREAQEAEAQRRRAVEALEGNEKRFSAILENSADAFVLLDANGIILHESANVPRLTGVPVADRVGRNGFETIHPDDLPRVKETFLRLLKEPGGKVTDLHFRAVRPDQEIWWAEATAMNLLDDPAVGAVVINYRDISERMRAEEMLRKSEERLRLHVEHTPIAVIEYDVRGRFIRWNPAAERLFGFKSEEVVGLHTDLIIPKELRHRIGDVMHDVMSHGVAKAHVNENVTKDGRTIVCEWYNSPLISADGTLSGMAAFAIDVTERERATQALARSEDKYRNLFGNAEVGMLVTKLDGFEILECNEKFLRMLGAAEDEVKGKSSRSLWADQTQRERMMELLRTEGRVSNHECEIRTRNGEIITCVASLHADVERGILEGSIQDITERTRAEAIIREQSRDLAMLLDIGRALTRTLKLDEVLQTLVDNATRLFGLDMGAIYAVQGDDLYLEAARPRFPQEYPDRLRHAPLNDHPHVRRCIETGEPVSIDDSREADFTPAERAIAELRGLRSILFVPMKMEDRVSGVLVLGTTGDRIHRFTSPEIELYRTLSSQAALVIENARLHDSTQRAEKRYHDLFASATEGLMVMTTEGRIVEVNRAFAEMHGCSMEEIPGKSIAEFDARGVNAISSRGDVLERLQRGETVRFEAEHRRADGTTFAVAITTSTIPINGEPHFFAFHQDIETRKRSEQQLKESHDRYRQLVENTSEGIFSVNPEGRIIFANAGFCAMLGYTPEEATRLNILDTYPDEIREEGAVRLAAVRRGQPLSFERTMKRKDGSLVLIEASTWKTADGNTQAFIRDMTQKKEAEEALKHSQAVLSESQRIAQLGSWEFDVETDRLTWSDEVYRIFGIGTPEFGATYEAFLERVHPDDRAAVDQAYAGSVEAGADGYEIEHRIVRKDTGEVRIVEEKCVHTRDGNGRIVRSIGMVHDVTDRKRAEDERNRLEKQLLQSQRLEAIGTLSSGIAHDFNNLLSIIVGNLSLIELAPNDAEKVMRRVEGMKKATDRAAQLVNQLLTFARKADIQPRPVNLNDIIEELVRLLVETFPKSIVIQTNLNPNLPTFNADPNQLHQVLLNLSVNARDAMPNGGTLTLSTAQEDGEELRKKFPAAKSDVYMEIRVKDSGSGMNETVRKRIFDPFFTTKGVGKGSGLGLPVALGIVERHEGFIDVVSEVGSGSEFRVYLPLVQNVGVIVEEPEAEIDAVAGGEETVLFIEDEELIREAVVEVLERKGYTVLTAGDGNAGMERYRKHRREISIVLSDRGLPGIDGDEVFRRMRKMDPSIRFILLTGYVPTEKKAELLEQGISAVVHKPYKLGEVLAKVRTILDRKG